MAGDFKMEITLKGTRYVLNRAAAEELLKAVEAFGDDCGEPCKRLRSDLRKALAMSASDGKTAEVIEETTVNLTIAFGGDGSTAARCAWCGEPGVEQAMQAGDSEPLFVCRTPGCQRYGIPATRQFFTTGYR